MGNHKGVSSSGFSLSEAEDIFNSAIATLQTLELTMRYNRDEKNIIEYVDMSNTFIPYEKAISIIGAHKGDFHTESKNLEDCIGAYLAEDLIADRDFPPFDRVTMDGIAIDYSSFRDGQRQFAIEATAPAGSPQRIIERFNKLYRSDDRGHYAGGRRYRHPL